MLALTLPATAADRAKSAPAKAKATRPAAVGRVWPAETLSGKIMMVKPDQQLMVVQAAGGAPFDRVVMAKTRVVSASQTIRLKDLVQDQNRQVSTKFVPERRGDVAESIRVGG